MKLFSNLLYDIRAIKKYGLLTHLKYLFDYDHVIINLHTYLDYIPAFKERPGYEIREVDINDPEIIKQWVDIVNDAFRHKIPYDVDSAKKYLDNHLYKKVEKIFFLFSEDKPVGTYFLGFFKNNTDIGTTGRLAVKKDFQGKGLGKYLVLFGLNKLKENRYSYAEHVFVVGRDYSIRVYLKCGSRPEFREKYLQLKPTRKNIFVTYLARRKVRKMYRKHLGSLDKAYLR